MTQPQPIPPPSPAAAAAQYLALGAVRYALQELADQVLPNAHIDHQVDDEGVFLTHMDLVLADQTRIRVSAVIRHPAAAPASSRDHTPEVCGRHHVQKDASGVCPSCAAGPTREERS
jgi:hypothetical protein